MVLGRRLLLDALDLALLHGGAVAVLLAVPRGVVRLDVVAEVLLVLELLVAGLAGEDLAVLVPLLVPLAQLDRVEHNVAEGAAVVLPLLWVEVGHPVLAQLLLVLERPAADVALALQWVLVVVVDSLVLHPPAVGGEDGAALPAADVRLDTRVRVEVPLHVRLDVEPLAADVAGELHVAGVLPLVLLKVVALLVLLAAAGKLAGEALLLPVAVGVESRPLPLALGPVLGEVGTEVVGLGETSMVALLVLEREGIVNIITYVCFINP